MGWILEGIAFAAVFFGLVAAGTVLFIGSLFVWDTLSVLGKVGLILIAAIYICVLGIVAEYYAQH